MKLHNKHFIDRQEISTALSYGIMEKLFEKKIIKSFIRAKKTEDISGVDYFFTWEKDGPDKKLIQFKNREDKFQDFPVSRFQPFYGVGNSKTKDGRDYRALRDKKNDYYFTAVKPDGKNYSEIIIIESAKLFDLILEAEKEWFGNEDPWLYFNTELCEKTTNWNKKLKTASNGVQAWFKRTASEAAAKINIYVPRIYAEQVVKL
jgi:glucan-binding YG repeat protein